MREIKFEYIFTMDNKDGISDESIIVTLEQIKNGEIDGWLSCCYCITAKIKAIRQYTGIKDKNGKEIYEGDIVLFEGITNYVVKFIRGGFAVDFKDGHRYLGQFANPEIIGNIYQNPELLHD